MTPKELLIVRAICLIIFAFASLIKFVYWRNARMINEKTKGFFSYYFKWYSMYTLYDTDYADIREFLQANNFTNKVVWICSATFVFSYVINFVFGS